MYFDMIHRIVCISNISWLSGHLTNDALYWAVLQAIKINEDNTTSSSHIFVTESTGLPMLKTRSVVLHQPITPPPAPHMPAHKQQGKLFNLEMGPVPMRRAAVEPEASSESAGSSYAARAPADSSRQ